MTIRHRHWFREPLWWLAFLIGVPLSVACALMLWALLDRSPPAVYRGLHAGAYDPATRILSLQWIIQRHRYCPGELVRSIEAQVGGTISLPSVVIDPDAMSPELRAARIGTTYVGGTTLIEVPPTVGGTIKLTTIPRFVCSPFQIFAPIEASVPPIIFTIPDPKSWAGGGMPVQVGPLPE
jgi:hypothetical protein